ncbi:hypothetical protein L195_g052182 [Trifolium pratense]|uniref:Uncharacterized protein n=1 Tax=Trifolium pratense TaxID=57577 RepID=A0A2K3K3T7_TRIPR|nr:hypothetical protein L195_g052182 [Trifolium pratense]
MLVCIWTYRLSIVEKKKKRRSSNMIMELRKILEDSDDDDVEVRLERVNIKSEAFLQHQRRRENSNLALRRRANVRGHR